jgi:protein TorT
MAEMIWTNRVSNFVRRMARYYETSPTRTIAAIGLGVALCLTPATAGTGRSVCVLVPHFKDEYWLSVGYGLEQEAARQKLELLFFQAGGYRARAQQIEQIETCVKHGVDAILIGAVTSDHPDLINAVAEASSFQPVIGLVNELHAETLNARIGVDWRDMGAAVGLHLSERHPEGSSPATAVLISGPKEAGWTAPLEEGLRAALNSSSVEILEVMGADTGLRQQLELVETALETYPDVDYVIGSAPAVEAAMGLFETKARSNPPQLFSTYISHTVLRGLIKGSVAAAPFDDPAMQGVMALRQATLAGAPDQREKQTGPGIRLLTSSSSKLNTVQVSPAGYFPDIR